MTKKKTFNLCEPQVKQELDELLGKYNFVAEITSDGGVRYTIPWSEVPREIVHDIRWERCVGSVDTVQVLTEVDELAGDSDTVVGGVEEDIEDIGGDR